MDMDEFSKTLKGAKKGKSEDEGDPTKKQQIMGMHAEGDEINFIRCEECSERFPADQLEEFNGLYYCSNCLQKVQSEAQSEE